MPFFSRVFRSKDSTATKKQAKPATTANPGPAKPKWTDAWQRTEVAPEEVQDLIRGCAQELKARGGSRFLFQPCGGVTAATRILRIADHSFNLALDTPFLLLPFRPSSDPSAARTFIRNYFNQSFEQGAPISGDALMQELRLNEPMVRTVSWG